MAETKVNKRRSRAYEIANRDLQAARQKAIELERALEEIAAEDDAMAKAQVARLGLASAVYDILGVEPEPKRETERQVRRGGKAVSETIRVDRDVKEVARAKWAALLLERMVEKLGPLSLKSLQDGIEKERKAARDAADEKRAEREVEKRAEREVETVVEAPPVSAGLVLSTVSPDPAVSHDNYYGDEQLALQL